MGKKINYMILILSILLSLSFTVENFCFSYEGVRIIRGSKFAQKLSEIEGLLVQTQEISNPKQKAKLISEIESLIYQLHNQISSSDRAEFITLKKSVAENEINIKDVFNFFYGITALPALRNKKGTQAWKLSDGSFMDTDAHNKEVIKSLQILKNGNYEYFNRRRDGVETLNKKKFNKIASIYREILSNPEEREIIWITSSLHDYGKLLLGNHYVDGVKLVSDILKKLHVESDKINFISNLIFTHADPGMISLGEVPPQKIVQYMENNNIQEKEKFLKMLMVLNITDVNAVGEGKVSNQYLKERLFFSEAKNLNRLNEVFNKVRISGLLGGPVAELDNKGKIDVEEIKENTPEVINEMYQKKINLDEKESFFNEFMRNMKFDYATFLIRDMNPGNVMKWLYLNAKMVEVYGKDIQMIRNTSDRVSNEINKIFNDIGIRQIRKKLEEEKKKISESLKSGDSVEVFGIPFWLEREELLVIDTAALVKN